MTEMKTAMHEAGISPSEPLGRPGKNLSRTRVSIGGDDEDVEILVFG